MTPPEGPARLGTGTGTGTGAADAGLFGPGSVTWRVHTEPILFLAGLRALFLQALHPRALAGVTQNSGFKAEPWGRFLRTVGFVSTAIHGTTAQAEAAGRRVRAVHARLFATDPITGERFRVDEPELLRWVHMSEVDSYASTARRAGVRLTAAEWDGYWDEQRRRAALVGLDPATVPGSAVEAADYFRAIRPRLRMTREAADTLLFLAFPPPPWRSGGWRAALDRLTHPPFRLAALGVATTAFSLLPPWARRLYGSPGLPTTDLAATVSARALRLALHAVPPRVFESLPGPPPPAAAVAARLVPPGPAMARSRRSRVDHES